MNTLNAIIERGKDGFYAYIKQIDGCVAGGDSYSEVKENLEEIINLFLEEDKNLQSKYKDGFQIRFEVDLQSVFDLLPEINISQLAKLGHLNPGLLRQYVSGTKTASEAQTQKVMDAMDKLKQKINTIAITP